MWKDKAKEKSVEERVEIVISIFEKYNTMKTPLDKIAIARKATLSLEQNSCVEFLQFSCPKIDAAKLSSNDPNEYITTEPDDRISSEDQRLANLIRELFRSGIPSFLNIVLVDTDEDDYVFPITGSPEGLDKGKLNDRKLFYFQRFKDKWRSGFGLLITKQCYRWSEIRDVNEIPLENIDEGSLQNEVARLREIFSKGNYYNGWITPSDDDLLKITELKFKAYANQGYQLTRYFPNSILIQNEFPLELRTKMLNLLNDSENKIPAIYPYGRSESPY